jgi:hypothetical protein
MARKGSLWDKPKQSGGRYRYFPPGGISHDPLPAYISAPSRDGMPVQRVRTLTIGELGAAVRARRIKWWKDRGTGMWYRSDRRHYGYASEVDLLIDAAGTLRSSDTRAV